MPLSTQAWSICCPAGMCCGLLLIQHYLSLSKLNFPHGIRKSDYRRESSAPPATASNNRNSMFFPREGWGGVVKTRRKIQRAIQGEGGFKWLFKKHLHSWQLVTDSALQGFLTMPFRELDSKLHWALGKERYRRLRNGEDLQEYRDLAEICIALL